MKIIGVAFDITEDALMTAQLKAAKDEAIAKNIELEIAKNRIEHNSLHDPLTALANRRKLDIALERLTLDGCSERQEVRHPPYRPRPVQGDQRHARPRRRRCDADPCVAGAVAKSARQMTSSRIGGDEFVILALNASDADMSALAGRIIEEMRQPIDFEGFRLPLRRLASASRWPTACTSMRARC